MSDLKNYTIAVAGTGYVGLSIATLLSQHHQVTAVERAPLWWQLVAFCCPNLSYSGNIVLHGNAQ